MKIKTIIFSTLILFLLILNTNAQDTLSYDRVLDEALKRNLFLKNELLNIDLARGEYYRTNSFFPKFPEIDVEYETDKFYDDQGSKLFSLML